MEEENRIATKGALQGAIEGIAEIFDRISAALSKSISTALLAAQKVVAETIECTKDILVLGEIKANDINAANVHCSYNISADGDIFTEGNISAPNGNINAETFNDINLADVVADINRLKRAVKIAGVKYYKGSTDTNRMLKVLLEVDPSLFGEVPLLDSTCNVRVRAVIPGRTTPTYVTLGTKVATLTTETQGFTTLVGCERAIVRMQPFEVGSRSFAAVLDAEIEVSTDISGSYVVLYSIPVNLTCVEEA